MLCYSKRPRLGPFTALTTGLRLVESSHSILRCVSPLQQQCAHMLKGMRRFQGAQYASLRRVILWNCCAQLVCAQACRGCAQCCCRLWLATVGWSLMAAEILHCSVFWSYCAAGVRYLGKGQGESSPLRFSCRGVGWFMRYGCFGVMDTAWMGVSYDAMKCVLGNTSRAIERLSVWGYHSRYTTTVHASGGKSRP
jgi:hypothetical protein